MKKLTVTIKGVPGSGKTTTSLLIARALMDAGFGVNNEDFDVVNNAAMPELQRARLDALIAADVIIDIVTVQHRFMPEHLDHGDVPTSPVPGPSVVCAHGRQ